MDVYKIKNEDGLYSNGEAGNIKWNKQGKSWTSIGYLKVHLIAVYNRNRPNFKKYKNCKIVRYEVVEAENLDIMPTIKEIEINEMQKIFKR
jgi:hypothetical protein